MIVPAVTAEEKATLIDYLSIKIGADAAQMTSNLPHEVVAVVRNGAGLGAVLYTNYRTTSIEMLWAGDPGWVTRGDLRQIFAYPFLQLGVFRVWGSVLRSNDASRQFAKDVGCREIGVLEHEYGMGRDAVLYSMTRERCRWIQPAGATQVNGKRNGTVQGRCAQAAGSLQGRGRADKVKQGNGARAGAPCHDGANV